jgi:hypothetical protein
MLFLPEYRRRSIIPLGAVGLAIYYLLVFAPLGRRSQELDEPLLRSWKALASALGQTNALSIDFSHITNQLNATREALVVLETARKRTAARLELDASLRSKLDAPFQLVEYQNERSQEIDSLVKLAKQQGVTVEPSALAGLPEHTVDIMQPELLWAALSVADGLLTTALQCKVTAIHSLDAPVTLTNAPTVTGAASLAELPFRLELTGPVQNVARFLQTLPLRGAEARVAGLPDVPVAKPPIFVERLVMKKQTPERPDEVWVSLSAVGFVYRE